MAFSETRMKRIASAVLAIAAAGLTVFVPVAGEREGLRVIEPGQPLPMAETVQLRVVEDRTGREEIWTVTKRYTSPQDRQVRPLPKPDPATARRERVETARVLHDMALEAWTRGEIRTAMSLLERAIESDPDDPYSRTHYGRLMLLAMSHGDAFPHLQRAAELNPYDSRVWLDLATYYEKTLRLERSWEALRRAEELAGGRGFSRDERSGFWVIEGESIYPWAPAP